MVTVRYFGDNYGQCRAGELNSIRIKCTSENPLCYVNSKGDSLHHIGDGMLNVSKHTNAHFDDCHPTLINKATAHHLTPVPGDSLLLPGCNCHFFVKDGKAVTEHGTEIPTIELIDVFP